MPSKSPAQARLMAAIAHGWKPPIKSGIAVPMSVAKDFYNADHPRAKKMAEGGLSSMRFSEPRRNEHTGSSTQDLPIGHSTAAKAIREGMREWLPGAAAIPGDLLDMAIYGGRKILSGQKDRSVPYGGLGAATRRLVKGVGPSTETSMTELRDEHPAKTITEMLNPAYMMNPKHLMDPRTIATLAALHGAPSASLLGAIGAIKPKGGNWLGGSVENVLGSLKRGLTDNGQEMIRRGLLTPEQVAARPEFPVNKWIEGPLTKYVKNQMGTTEDVIPRLADQGIQAVEAAYTDYPSNVLKARRQHMGMPIESTRITPEGRAWENSQDMGIVVKKAKDLSNAMYTENPWLSKLKPEDPVYSLDDSSIYESGFGHITDELRNALNPESGLPAHLQLTPEQMSQLGMEKAIRHVADINKWRMEKAAESSAEMNQSPAVHTLREYSENNPKGLKWVELKTPSYLHDNPEWGVAPSERGISGEFQVNTPNGPFYFPDEATAKKELTSRKGRKFLQDQLKYEGDTMGHCVGGYCDDVESGNSRIFSLRDAKGEPHVTIETSPNKVTSVDPDNPRAQAWINERAKQYKDEYGEGAWDAAFDDYINEEPFAAAGDSIVQIKGKQNAKPKDEYLPFVQDFVRNHPEGGQWGEIGDFGNTGLWRHPKTGELHTKAEAEADEALGKIYDSRNLDDNGDYIGGYAEGGLVFSPEGYPHRLKI